MSIPRFYVTKEDVIDNKVVIKGGDAKHFSRVLRCRKGDKFKTFDGSGYECSFVVEEINSSSVTGIILSKTAPPVESSLPFILCQAIPKGQKMDFIVEKATELGVAEIFPIITSRSLSNPSCQKIERWRNIAREASCQSGRVKIVHVHGAINFTNIFTLITLSDRGFLFSQSVYSKPLKEVVQNNSPSGKIFIFIGPEGDFTDAEIEMAKSKNFYLSSLGPRILRTETAGLVALSIILYEWNGLYPS